MKPKILFIDIETSPIIAQVWGLFDQNIGLNQIQEDWRILSWAAKWSDSNAVLYDDCQGEKSDERLIRGMHKLLLEADIIIGQNSDRFDIKKLNARFVKHDLGPVKPTRTYDTLKLAKKYFAFTSNKLEYMSHELNIKYKKLKHREFVGHELWSQCLKGNKAAWQCMEKYNKYDVLATEEVFWRLQPYAYEINVDSFHEVNTCICGGTQFQKRGTITSKVAVRQRYQCKSCGKWSSTRENLLLKERRKTIRM